MARDRPSVTLERLEQAAARLRPVEREMLRLSARDRLSCRDIAARLGRTPEEVERLLADTLCRLDREIERRERPWWRFW